MKSGQCSNSFDIFPSRPRSIIRWAAALPHSNGLQTNGWNLAGLVTSVWAPSRCEKTCLKARGTLERKTLYCVEGNSLWEYLALFRRSRKNGMFSSDLVGMNSGPSGPAQVLRDLE